jgi:hypothetical protein
LHFAAVGSRPSCSHARLARSTALSAPLAAAWGIAAIGFILLLVLGFHPNALGGLYERLFLGGELLWLAIAMGWLLRLRARSRSGRLSERGAFDLNTL